jgi:hypothetical protein
MPQIPGAAADQLDSNDLISFLKAIPDGRFRRGVRYPQWFLLLVAVLGILSGSRSSRDLEAFAKRHRQEFNQALGLDFKRWPSDATFLYLFNKAHLQTFGDVFQAWMISQIPGGTEGLEQLVCVAPASAQRLERRSDAQRWRRKTAVTGLWPRSRSMPGPSVSPWPRRPTTPTNPARGLRSKSF